MKQRICKLCNSEILNNGRSNAQFCNPTCYSVYRKQKNAEKRIPNCECSWCHQRIWKNSTVHRKSMKKHGKIILFCDKNCRYKAQRLNGVSDIHPKHYGTAKISYRQLAFSAYPKKCMICGYDENELALDVHHKDENHENNDISNLEILCCNHHMIYHRSRGLQII